MDFDTAAYGAVSQSAPPRASHDPEPDDFQVNQPF
jgi:hypothetical protein